MGEHTATRKQRHVCGLDDCLYCSRVLQVAPDQLAVTHAHVLGAVQVPPFEHVGEQTAKNVVDKKQWILRNMNEMDCSIHWVSNLRVEQVAPV